MRPTQNDIEDALEIAVKIKQAHPGITGEQWLAEQEKPVTDRERLIAQAIDYIEDWRL